MEENNKMSSSDEVEEPNDVQKLKRRLRLFPDKELVKEIRTLKTEIKPTLCIKCGFSASKPQALSAHMSLVHKYGLESD